MFVTPNEAKRLGVVDVTSATSTRRVELIPAFMSTLIQPCGLLAGEASFPTPNRFASLGVNIIQSFGLALHNF